MYWTRFQLRSSVRMKTMFGLVATGLASRAPPAARVKATTAMMMRRLLFTRAFDIVFSSEAGLDSTPSLHTRGGADRRSGPGHRRRLHLEEVTVHGRVYHWVTRSFGSCLGRAHVSGEPEGDRGPVRPGHPGRFIQPERAEGSRDHPGASVRRPARLQGRAPVQLQGDQAGGRARGTDPSRLREYNCSLMTLS